MDGVKSEGRKSEFCHKGSFIKKVTGSFCTFGASGRDVGTMVPVGVGYMALQKDI